MFLPDRTIRPDELGRLVDHAKDAGDFLKALAHQSRPIVLCIPAAGERPVNKPAAMLSVRRPILRPTLSQHPSRLRPEGLVKAVARRQVGL